MLLFILLSIVFAILYCSAATKVDSLHIKLRTESMKNEFLKEENEKLRRGDKC